VGGSFSLLLFLTGRSSHPNGMQKEKTERLKTKQPTGKGHRHC
jgi:hypothetical protein